MSMDMPTASTSKLPAAPLTAAEKKKARSTDPYADYSTAESLGFVDEEAAKVAAQATLRKQEGSIGQWEKVSSKASSSTFGAKRSGKEPTAEEAQEMEEKAEEAKRLKEEEREWRIKEEEKFNRLHDRDNHRDYLQPKTYSSTVDDIYDPSKVAIKLKRSRLTIKEEQELAVTIKREAEELADEEREKARIKLEERGAGGWNEVEVTNDAMVFADVKEEEAKEESEDVAAVVGSEGEAVVKEEEVVVEVKSAFKKRKVNASQRKR